MTDVKALEGLTLSDVRVDRYMDRIEFISTDGRRFEMAHFQDCCETVTIEDVIGDIDDLTGSPILTAEERSNQMEHAEGSQTWTFYTLRTIKGTVDIRWLGQSNGYYSESVDFYEVKR